MPAETTRRGFASICDDPSSKRCRTQSQTARFMGTQQSSLLQRLSDPSSEGARSENMESDPAHAPQPRESGGGGSSKDGGLRQAWAKDHGHVTALADPMPFARDYVNAAALKLAKPLRAGVR